MNILKINGTPIPGIFVDAAISFNKPAKRVQTFEVPGRNGNLIIDEGTFDNVLITYPVFEKSTFPAEFDDIVNWLASLEGYQRIECSNDPQHYRLGRFVVPQNPTAKRLNRDGYWQLSFDCKPQRWLLSGEEDTEVDANPQETYEGVIATFEATPLDVISDLKLDITPVQNLNGQPNPYPAGGGVNLLPPIATTTVNNVTLTSDNGQYKISTSGAASATTDFNLNINVSAGTYTLALLNSATTSNITVYLITASGTGNPSTSPTVANNYTTFTKAEGLVTLRIRVASGASLSNFALSPMLVSGSTAPTAYAPYSNICPISGWTGAEAYVRGTNIWDEEWEVGTISPSNGQNENSSAYSRSKNYVSVFPSTNYYFKIASTLYIRRYGRNKEFLGYSQHSTSTNYTTPSDTYYIRFVWAGQTYSNDISINYPTTDHDYHAYNGDTHIISWEDEAGTVYGGTLDVTTGVLTVTHIMYDGGDLTWEKVTNSVYRNFYAQATTPIVNSNTRPTIQSSAYKSESNNSASATADNYVWSNGLAPNNAIGVKDTSKASMSAAEFKIAMSGVQFLSELATPLTYQLTPTEVETLLGINNIWGNTGDISVTVTTPSNFINPGNFPSRPLLRIYGTGTVRINDVYITIAAHTQPYIDIDCEMQECYYEDTNMNEYVTFSTGEYPELEPGNNYVLLGSGITKIDVTPRWWEL